MVAGGAGVTSCNNRFSSSKELVVVEVDGRSTRKLQLQVEPVDLVETVVPTGNSSAVGSAGTANTGGGGGGMSELFLCLHL